MCIRDRHNTCCICIRLTFFICAPYLACGSWRTTTHAQKEACLLYTSVNELPNLFIGRRVLHPVNDLRLILPYNGAYTLPAAFSVPHMDEILTVKHSRVLQHLKPLRVARRSLLPVSYTHLGHISQKLWYKSSDVAATSSIPCALT